MIFHVIDESALGAWPVRDVLRGRDAEVDSLPAIRDAATRRAERHRRRVPGRSPPVVAISTNDGSVVADAADDVGVGKVTLTVNGAVSGMKYAAPYAFAWTPTRNSHVHARRAGRPTPPGIPSARPPSSSMRRARQRGDAVVAGFLDAHASAAATRARASAEEAAPSRMTRGVSPLKSRTVDGVPGSSPASTTAPT